MPHEPDDFRDLSKKLKGSLRRTKFGFTSTGEHLKHAFILLLGFTAHAFGAGLSSYPHVVVADSAGTPRNGVRVTYLGTNGYQFEFNGHAVLVDPYFSRVDLLSVGLGARIQPNISRITDAMRHLAPKVDAILVTHGH